MQTFLIIKITREERNIFETFDWKLKGRTEHNRKGAGRNKKAKRSGIRIGIGDVDLIAYQELKHILDIWNLTKKRLKLKLRKWER